MTTISFTQGHIYPDSITRVGDKTYYMVRLHENGERRLVVQGAAEAFRGEPGSDGMLLCPLSPANAAALRQHLAWLNPVPLGNDASFGFGDRLGIATPGHIQALRATRPGNQSEPFSIAPVFAQQSVRENSRTGRSPQEVLDDAMWGVFQMGWCHPWGADADHVMDVPELSSFVQAGYSFFTLDPSKHVDGAAATDSINTLERKVTQLPWREWGVSDDTLYARYCEKPFNLNGFALHFDRTKLLRAIVKYGAALVHSVAVARELERQMSGRVFDLEVSVDESETPTSVYEHFFIANELREQGVRFTSLAPRFVGKFQKGVDYIGDPELFAKEFVPHVAVAQHFGHYRLSIHTGSDKFSIYQAIAEQSGGCVHVKTAGTSYLEALRVVALYAPELFGDILELSRSSFERDRATYSLDADVQRVPALHQVLQSDFPTLLDVFDARQVLHVAYGSVLQRYGKELMDFLQRHEADYMEGLSRHFERHLTPLISL